VLAPVPHHLDVYHLPFQTSRLQVVQFPRLCAISRRPTLSHLNLPVDLSRSPALLVRVFIAIHSAFICGYVLNGPVDRTSVPEVNFSLPSWFFGVWHGSCFARRHPSRNVFLSLLYFILLLVWSRGHPSTAKCLNNAPSAVRIPCRFCSIQLNSFKYELATFNNLYRLNYVVLATKGYTTSR